MHAWFKSFIRSFLQPVLRYNLSLGFIDDSQYPRAHGQSSSAWADSTNVIIIDNWSVSQTFFSLELSQLWIIVSCFSCRVWFIGEISNVRSLLSINLEIYFHSSMPFKRGSWKWHCSSVCAGQLDPPKLASYGHHSWPKQLGPGAEVA